MEEQPSSISTWLVLVKSRIYLMEEQSVHVDISPPQGKVPFDGKVTFNLKLNDLYGSSFTKSRVLYLLINS